MKEAVFPFVKFPEADPILGPEMKSTGEVMGTGRTFAEAYAKAQGIRIINHSVGWFNTSRGDGSGAAGTPDAEQPAGTVFVRATEQDAQNPLAIACGGALEKHINRRPAVAHQCLD